MSNNLSGDPCQLNFQQKRSFFEMLQGQHDMKQRSLQKGLSLSHINIFPKKHESSTSDNNNNNSTPSLQTSSSKGYPKKLSTSTTEVTSAPNTSSSIEYPKNRTPTSTESSGGMATNFLSTHHSTAKKPQKLEFRRSAQEILFQGNIQVPEILEVFTDLDQFIEKELDEISVQKRLDEKLNQSEGYNKVAEVYSKLKNEYVKDKEQFQKEFEEQINLNKLNCMLDCDAGSVKDEDEIALNMTFTSRQDFQRRKKIEKMNLEAIKQEYLLSKINRVLDHVHKLRVSDKNLAAVVNIERHYLVAGSRFQSAFNESERLQDPSENFHPVPFHRKGKCVISEIMLEVKSDYFERCNQIRNEYIVVLLKYDELVYATDAICITNDIRTIKFPHKFKIPEAYMDFEMRLEIYGTTFWRKHSSIRQTMFKKYGSFSFSLVDSGETRSRFEMVEAIKSEHNPLRKKVLMKIRQKITAEVYFESNLELKLSDSWYKTHAVLCGNLIEITSLEDECESMVLDLYNFETSFVIPVVTHVSKKPFTFMLKFNHCVNGNFFSLLLAAENDEDYNQWINSINRVLVLIKN